jgi:DNA polymerase
MEIVTADFETYYDSTYSLSKMTNEEYVLDPRFEVIMLGLRWPDGTKEIVTGTHAEIKYRLDAVDWSGYAILCHNTIFDASIFSWHFGVRPAAWLDTLSMARAMHGSGGNSLASLAKKYCLEDKKDTVHNMMARTRDSLSPVEFQQYAEYCLHDVELCYSIFHFLSTGWYSIGGVVDYRGPFPKKELKLIDAIIRMYTEPVLRLNREKLQEHYDEVVARKEKLLTSSGFEPESLLSNNKFAEVLQGFGVEPPMKVSPTTGKPAYAFAKTDQGLKDLAEHPDERVQAVVAARLGVKSTLEETRTLRFIGMVDRSPLFPVPLKYGAARTHRLGGMDKINLQNLPSRGTEAGKLKRCIEAPPGHIIIDCDSSNIEARMLAWLAGQSDLVTDFANGVDVYCKMATRIYGREITKEDKLERFVGKTVVLGAGYKTGAIKLQNTLKGATPPMLLESHECERIIDTYRSTYSMIPRLWGQGKLALQAMHDDRAMWFGREGVVRVEGHNGIKLPSGLYIQYPQLRQVPNAGAGIGWEYKDVVGWTGLYDGKLTENIVQALARIVVMEQLLKIAKRYRVVLTVHDAVACVAYVGDVDKAIEYDPDKKCFVPVSPEAREAVEYVEQCMRWVPEWASGCPINCESGIGRTYGEC